MLVGDALTRRDVARLRALAPAATVVNLYGSTETQRALAYHVVEERGEEAREVLPLGRGMRDVQLLVLNRAGRLAGLGEVGEIALRSPHLARGYLGDPELTAARFQVNPFTQEQGDRLYRTGDLGRFLVNGEAEFVGRMDDQLKIRGFRVEPQEIRCLLGEQGGVRDSVILLRQEVDGDKRLICYFVPATEPAPAAGELRTFLRGRLPAYMIPAVFVPVPAIPLTPNGKIDRRALPPPESVRGAADESYLSPRTELESRIAAIWRELLGVERVGMQDNFFDLGGHSLLLVRAQSRLQEALGREITVLDLFQNPTVGALARFLSQDTAEDREKGQERIEDRSRKLLDARARKKERMREIKKRK
jgi:acyl carrier protein